VKRLSPRERQVLKHVVEGRTSKEIARLIGIKPSSIDTYRSRIMAKLEINDIPSLVRFAIRHGVIKP
jgi:DNA-binding CsgD family transcriptional regulator